MSSASTSAASACSTTSRRPRPRCSRARPSSRAPRDCALDIGLVSLAPRAAHAFLELGRTRVGGGTLLEALGRRPAAVRPLPRGADGVPRVAVLRGVLGEGGPASALPRDLARAVYEAFHPFGLGGAVTRSTVFEHVGSLAELPEASRGLLTHRVAPFYEKDGGEIRPFEAPDRIVHNSVGVELAGRGAGARCSSRAARRARCRPSAGTTWSSASRASRCPSACRAASRSTGGTCPRAASSSILSAGDSLKPEGDPARLVFCGRPLDEWLEERGLVRGDVFDGGEGTRPLRRAALLPRPDAGAAGGLPAQARRGVDAGLPRRAPPVDRRDQRPGRRGAPGGPARRAAPRGAPGALPAGPGLVRDERARLRGRLRRGRVARSAARSGSRARTTPLLRAYRERLFRAAFPGAARRRRLGPGHRVRGARRGARAPAPGAQGGPDRLGARARCGSTSPAAGPTPRPTPCARAGGS